MIAYRARHACGAELEDALPDDYPVEEGVGLYCPACRESFWHVPEEAPRFLPPRAPSPDGAAPVRRRRWRA